MSSFVSKFLYGTIVRHMDWGGWWQVVLGTPDADGKIVVVNQDDEYSLVRQADMEEAE